MSVYIVLGAIVVVLFIYAIIGLYQKINLRSRFKSDYFDWGNENYDFESLNYIRRYWDFKNQAEGDCNIIDDTTWNDLDMDRLFFKMNACQSSIGEEFLYAKLRSVSFDEDALLKFAAAMDFMDANPNIKAEALYALHNLGKDLYNNIHTYIYKIDEQPIKNIRMYYILMFLPILSAVIFIFTPIGFILLLASLLTNIIVYYKNKFLLEIKLNSLSYISKTAYCAQKLSKLNFGALNYDALIKDALKPLHKLNGIANSLTHRASSEIEVLLEYVKIVFMWDFINYNRITSILSKHENEFHQLYKIIGELDSAIAVGGYRKSLAFYSAPLFGNSDAIIFNEVYHPLIDDPVCNSIDWKSNSIITGSNASGKSTFIKSLAITMICSQSIYICFARQYESRMSRVVTSMAVKDKIYDNESYFIAEIKSLKRVQDSINNQLRTVCFVDEILKGTNTVERISASASILHWLFGKNCMVMVASHDVELTEILANSYDNYHFREQVTDDGIFFDYTLNKGIAKTRNAINLLKFMGFGNLVTDLATELASGFETNRKWDIL